MAKKKNAAVKNKKAKAPVAEAAKNTVAEKAAPSKNGKMLVMVLIAFAIFAAVEIYFVSQASIVQSKKPTFVTSFDKPYNGITTMAEYGQYIYITDGERGEVRKVDKTNGKIEKIYTVKEGAAVTVADSAGNIYVLSGKNLIIQYDPNFKEMKRTVLSGFSNATWFEIDSEDNFYIADHEAGKVVKMPKDFTTRLLEFGGRGTDKGKFSNMGKIHLSNSGDIYVMDLLEPSGARMQVFDKTGKLKTAWKITKIKRFTQLENFTVMPDGYVYFNWFESHQILVFSPKGKFVSSWDSDEAKSCLIRYPNCISGGNSNMIYITSDRLYVLKPIKY